MNSTRLRDIKEEAARVLIQYSNGYLDARFRGSANEKQVFNNMKRMHYLWSIIRSAFLSDTDVYVGDTIMADNDFETVYEKLQHYNGIYSNVDLSVYSDITPDDGDGGSDDGDSGGGSTTSTDHWRAGNLPVVAGANAVTFLVGGVPSPLASADYTINAYVITSGGQRQDNLQITTQTAGGFVASDVLKAGTLFYTAILNT